jgi:hypothetical protein
MRYKLIDTIEFDAPAHWASAFINGDCSGFDDSDQAEHDAFCERELGENNGVHSEVTDCSEESFFGRFNGLVTDLATYTANVYEQETECGACGGNCEDHDSSDESLN